MSTQPPGMRPRSVPKIGDNQAADAAKKQQENAEHDNPRSSSNQRSTVVSAGGRSGDNGRGRQRGGKDITNKNHKNKLDDAEHSASKSVADGLPEPSAHRTATSSTGSSGAHAHESKATTKGAAQRTTPGAHTPNAHSTPYAAAQSVGAKALPSAQDSTRSPANENGRARADEDRAEPVDGDTDSPASTGSPGSGDDEPGPHKALSALLGTRGPLHLHPLPAAEFPPLDLAEFLPQLPADLAPQRALGGIAAGGNRAPKPIVLLSRFQLAPPKPLKHAGPESRHSAPSLTPRHPAAMLRQVSLPAIATLNDYPSSDDGDGPAIPTPAVKRPPPAFRVGQVNAEVDADDSAAAQGKQTVHTGGKVPREKSGPPAPAITRNAGPADDSTKAAAGEQAVAHGASADEDSDDPDFNPHAREDKRRKARTAANQLFAQAQKLCRTGIRHYPHLHAPVRCFNGPNCKVADRMVRPNDLVAEREMPGVNINNARDPDTWAKHCVAWHWQCTSNGQLWKLQNVPDLVVWSDSVPESVRDTCRGEISSATNPNTGKRDAKDKKRTKGRRVYTQVYIKGPNTKKVATPTPQVPPPPKAWTANPYPKPRERPAGTSISAFKRENLLHSMATNEKGRAISYPALDTANNAVAATAVPAPEHSNEAGPSSRAEVRRKLTALVNDKKRKHAADEEEADPSMSANANGKRKSKR